MEKRIKKIELLGENVVVDDDAGQKIYIQNVYGEIPGDIDDNAYLNIFRNDEKSVHNIALYPCKFIPQLPRWAIKNYSKKGDVILDPFSGGGTTLIEARKLGRNAYGFDYNPYAALLCKVKSDLYDKEVLINITENLNDAFLKDKSQIRSPEFKGIDFWFNKNVIRALSVIKKHVSAIKDKKVKDFFYVVFSMVVRKSSYIAPGQILTARRKDWKDIRQFSEEEVYHMFRSFAIEYVNYVMAFTSECKNVDSSVHVSIGDARDINVSKPIDLIISSPPYINAMDYVWANRLRLHWLDLVKDDNDRLSLYKKEIGTESIRSRDYEEIGLTGYESIDETIKEIYYSFNSNQQSKLRSRVVYKYFLDMEKHLKSAYDKLKKDGRYCIVIGDNNIRKIRVRTTDFLIEIAEEIGFSKELQYNILLKNRSLNVDRKVEFADLIKYDRMIVLKK